MSSTAGYFPSEPQAVPDDAIIAPERLAIAALGSPPIRLLGSFSTPVSLRPIDDDESPSPDDDPPPPPPPPPAVAAPDFGFQFAPCLTPALRGQLEAAVRQAFGAAADVRVGCIAGTERIGVWLRPLTPAMDSSARDRGLQRLALIGPGETFGSFVNAALIRSRAQQAWDAMPKRLNGEGRPDPGGPVHLTGFSLSFVRPNRVVTKISGYDERPWPDVDFTLTITDTIGVSGRSITCESDTDLAVDTSWINALTAIFLLTLPPLGIVFLVERIIIASIDDPDLGAGVGCRAAAMIPGEILIPGGLKVVLLYNRAEASAGGLFAGGTYVVVPRIAEVAVSGPSQVAIDAGERSLRRTYSARRLVDLREPLRFAWTAEGFPADRTAAETAVNFSLGATSAGQMLTRDVAVTVTDADGLVARDELTVSIRVTEPNDPADPSDDPICLVRPWLPQCQVGDI